jgi:hypothetical protein
VDVKNTCAISCFNEGNNSGFMVMLLILRAILSAMRECCNYRGTNIFRQKLRMNLKKFESPIKIAIKRAAMAGLLVARPRKSMKRKHPGELVGSESHEVCLMGPGGGAAESETRADGRLLFWQCARPRICGSPRREQKSGTRRPLPPVPLDDGAP